MKIKEDLWSESLRQYLKEGSWTDKMYQIDEADEIAGGKNQTDMIP